METKSKGIGKSLLTSFNKRGNYNKWEFDGREFRTTFYFTRGGVYFGVMLRQNPKRLRVSLWIHAICDVSPIDETPTGEADFQGDDRFEDAFDWLEQTATKRADELCEEV